MALAGTNLFASFDINAQTQILDISDVLSEALLLDFEFMSRGIQVSMDEPVEDVVFYWNEESLNPDFVNPAASQTSGATSFALSTGHGARVHIGDLLKDKVSGGTEVMQITDISSDTITVTRGYSGTTAASIAATATLVVMPAFQEGSDIGNDKSVKPIARTNFTQIMFAGDLQITRSQIKRKMATNALDVDRQLANRAKELKRYWTSASLYSEDAGPGSDSVYRTTLGAKGWITANGILNSASAALTLTGANGLNAVNKSVVDRGKYADRLIIGTDLVDSVNAIEASNRRLVESDKNVGYAVERILLGQGNEVEVVVDGRVHLGDAFLYSYDQLKWRPLEESAMFIIIATDFVDGVKRRVGSEAGIEFRNPEAAAYLSAKT